MKEKYYMLLLQKDSVLLNTFIDKSPARWAIENKEKRMVIIDFWEIEKEEYTLLSQ